MLLLLQQRSWLAKCRQQGLLRDCSSNCLGGNVSAGFQ
jgi:hypothetical protein